MVVGVYAGQVGYVLKTVRWVDGRRLWHVSVDVHFSYIVSNEIVLSKRL